MASSLLHTSQQQQHQRAEEAHNPIRRKYLSIRILARGEKKRKIIPDVTHTQRLKIITSSYRNGNETKNDMLLIHRSHVHMHIM